MGGYRKRGVGTALFGLIGAWSSDDRDLGTSAQIPRQQIPGDTLPTLASNAAPAVDENSTGIAVYNQARVVCHGTGVANAPRLGDQAAWEPRMAQGIDRLLATSIAGRGAMPLRGTCADCSDQDLKAAIEYMLIQVGYESAASPRTGDTP